MRVPSEAEPAGGAPAPAGGAPADGPALAVENIEVVYHHSVQVLRGLSLAVPRGRIVALLGSNGAGKTTTLKPISGLLPLEIGQVRSGAIRYLGERIDHVAPHLLARRGIASTVLDRGKLDSVAARVPGSEDTFVAALYVPGQQLILVSGQYVAPALLREKILGRRFREAYQDLYSASDPGTRWIVEDLRADGLRDRGKDGPFDVYTRAGGAPIFFDGQWKRHKLSEEAYRSAFQQADASYARMIGVLVSTLKDAGGAAPAAAQAAPPVP